jgi:hypothetical protein
LKHVETKLVKEEPQHTSNRINKQEDERLKFNTKVVEQSSESKKLIENKEEETTLQKNSNPFLIKLNPTSTPPQLPPKPRDLKLKTEITITNQVPRLESKPLVKPIVYFFIFKIPKF